MDANDSSVRRFLTLAEVADELGCSQSQVYALVRTGTLPAMKIGGRGQWRVARISLEQFINQSYEAAKDFVTQHPYGSAQGLADAVDEPA